MMHIENEEKNFLFQTRIFLVLQEYDSDVVCHAALTCNV